MGLLVVMTLSLLVYGIVQRRLYRVLNQIQQTIAIMARLISTQQPCKIIILKKTDIIYNKQTKTKNKAAYLSMNTIISNFPYIHTTIQNYFSFLSIKESLRLITQPIGIALTAISIGAIFIYRNTLSESEKSLPTITVLYNRFTRLTVFFHEIVRRPTQYQDLISLCIEEPNHNEQDFSLRTPSDVREFTQNLRTHNIPITTTQLRYFFNMNARAMLDETSTVELKQNFRTCYELIQQQFLDTKRPDAFSDIEIDVNKNILCQLAILDGAHRQRFLQWKTLPVVKNFIDQKTNDYLSELDSRLKRQPSVTGHPKDLIGEKDFYIMDMMKRYNQTNNLFTFPYFNFTYKINSAFEKASSICWKIEGKTGIEEILEAKKARFECALHPSIGCVIELKALKIELLRMFISSSSEDLNYIPIAFNLAQTNTLETDEASLNLFIEEHESANKEQIQSNVVIEGLGPSGSLSAITCYRAGANISIFEKRSEDFSRRQIVRLDPKWVETLKFYLGTKFDTFFKGDHPQGVLREDGFVEIVTRNLEELLLARATELQSLLHTKNQDNTFRIFTEREVVSVNAPAPQQDSFYTQIQKSGTQIEDSTPTDIIVCAGGKKSPMREAFLPSYSAVTESKYYGVCSWNVDSSIAHSLRPLNTFKDFRGVVKIDEEFIQKLKEKLQPHLQRFDDHITTLLKEFDLDRENRTIFQTRCFENRDTIYIGMELPQSLETLFNNILTHREIYDEGHKNNFVKLIRENWFQCIAEIYQLDRSLRLSIHNMEKDSVGSFPVAQEIASQPYSVIEDKMQQHLVTIVPVGDASASPHFMRYSGLTGARENVFQVADFIRSRNLHNLHTHIQKTQRFVIGRGSVFLNPLSEEEIIQNRKAKIKRVLDGKCPLDTPYLSLKKENGEYLITLHKDKKELMIITELMINDKGQMYLSNEPERLFDSWNQLKNYHGIHILN